jgi:hypothetical protein
MMAQTIPYPENVQRLADALDLPVALIALVVQIGEVTTEEPPAGGARAAVAAEEGRDVIWA